MTMTIPAQTRTTAAATDEIQIVQTPPSMADAQLLVQLQMLGAMTGAYRGFQLITMFEKPPTLAQVRKRYPRDSQEYQQITASCGLEETIATFVRQGILNEALVNDMFPVAMGWTLMEKFAKGIRRETGEPRLYENAEWLAKRAAAPVR